MKHIIRLFILIAALALGTDHAWAEVNDNPRVNFVYVDGDNYALTSDKGVAIASDEAAGQVTITVTINEGKDFRCIEGDLTAEQSINSGMGQARRRTSAEGPGNGVSVPVTCTNTNEFTLTLPDDESTNVTVYVKFSEKLVFTPEVSIEGWTYGDAAKTPTITGNTSGGDVTYTYFFKDGDVTYFEPNPQNAGTYFVKATVAATADYKECESEPVAFTISQAPLTVKANDHGIYYGNAAANNGVSYEGFVNNEDESVLGGTLTYTYSNANGDYGEGNDAPGKYDITPSGLDSNNYKITFEPGTLYVHPAHVSVRVVDKADGKGIETASVTVQVLDNGNQVTVCLIGWCADINDLKTGVTYTLRETVAPEGYVLPSDLTFTIDNEGKVTSSGSTTTDEFGNTVLLLENSKTRVEVSVVDITTKGPISGAPVQVLDGNGNVVKDLENNDVEWTSNGSTHTIEGLKTGVTYTLHETVAPDGYVRPTDYTFTIDVEGNVTTTNGTMTQEGVLLVENAKTHVEISVVDVADGEEIEGAHVQVIDSEGNVVKDLEENDVVWTSTPDNHVIEGLKTGVTYTLRETVAPEGYIIPSVITFTIENTGKITTTGTVTEEGVLLVENSKTHVEFSVVDKANRTALVGATIQVMDPERHVVKEWTSGTGSHFIEGLYTDVVYTLHEIVAPEGYIIPSDITFTIDETGEVTTTAGTMIEDGVLLVENSKTRVEISVIDIANEDELAGATIQVIDPERHVVKEWTSGTGSPIIEGLKTGIEYTLRETVAPEGYIIPSVITFTIENTGKITTAGTISEEGVLLVENSKTRVEISVIDIATREVLAGPTIQVIDPKGKVVEEWTSTMDNHIIEGLNTGDAYTLREKVAIEGYVGPSDDYHFTIDETGKITTTDPTATDEEGNTVLLVENIPTNGTWGDLTWALSDDGTLSITLTNPEGDNKAMNAASSNNGYPWYRLAGNVNTITIDKGVTSIADHAFQGCENLTSVTIPASVTSIGEDAFYQCTKVKDVYCYADPKKLAWTDDSNKDFKSGDEKTTCHVFNDSKWTSFTSVNVTFVNGLGSEACPVELTEGEGVNLLTDLANSLEGREDISSGTQLNVSFTRTFGTNSVGEGKVSTVCLPYAVTTDASVGTYYTFSGVTVENGVYTVKMNAVEAGAQTTAGTPYMYRPAAGGQQALSGTLTVAAEYPVDNTPADGWEFRGTFGKITWPSGQTRLYGFAAADFVTSDGTQIDAKEVGKFRRFGWGICDAFRCYLWAPAPSSSARGTNRSASQLPETMRVILVEADGLTTTIGTLDTRTGDVSFDSEAWYSIDGTPLNGQPTKKGVYIHNNKKVIIK